MSEQLLVAAAVAEINHEVVRRPHPGCVYFVSCGGHVKIGTTTSDPEKRVASLQTGSPDKLILRGWVDGWGREEEAELHKMLSYYRGRGEWFRDSGLVMVLSRHSRGRPESCGMTVGEFTEAAINDLDRILGRYYRSYERLQRAFTHNRDELEILSGVASVALDEALTDTGSH